MKQMTCEMDGHEQLLARIHRLEEEQMVTAELERHAQTDNFYLPTYPGQKPIIRERDALGNWANNP